MVQAWMFNMAFSALFNFLLHFKFSNNKNIMVNFDAHLQLLAMILREPNL